MLILISPAKTLDFETPATTSLLSQPDFLDHSQALIDQLKPLAPHELAHLMKLSDKLATLNAARFENWHTPFDRGNAKQAVLAFKGDVYTGLDAESLADKELQFAQKHLRILSGLYGLLRPLDLIQPYRLEMGTRFSNARGKDLYAFWGNLITDQINRELNRQQSHTLVNLASNEYFKALQHKALQGELITPVFKDFKGGKYKIISFYAKKARGLMSRYIIRNRIEAVSEIKAFDEQGYRFAPLQSTNKEWVFIRDTVPG